jgi:hypothetical protein
MVIACIALAVALGGTSYAAATLARNSVGTKQLKKNAVISSKVKNRSLLAVDFKAGQLPRGAQGPTGPTGATGATGATGPIGPSDAFSTYNNSFVNLTGTLTTIRSLALPAGKYFIMAKGILNNNDGTPQQVECYLTAGSDSDGPAGEYYTIGAQGTDDREVAVLQLVHDFTAGGTATLACNSTAANSNIIGPRIAAIKVGSITTLSIGGPRAGSSE